MLNHVKYLRISQISTIAEFIIGETTFGEPRSAKPLTIARSVVFTTQRDPLLLHHRYRHIGDRIARDRERERASFTLVRGTCRGILRVACVRVPRHAIIARTPRWLKDKENRSTINRRRDVRVCACVCMRACTCVRGISIVIAESEVAVRPVPPSPLTLLARPLSPLPRSSSFR